MDKLERAPMTPEDIAKLVPAWVFSRFKDLFNPKMANILPPRRDNVDNAIPTDGPPPKSLSRRCFTQRRLAKQALAPVSTRALVFHFVSDATTWASKCGRYVVAGNSSRGGSFFHGESNGSRLETTVVCCSFYGCTASSKPFELLSAIMLRSYY
ncbi:hypothetical protein BKA63DRAFT_226029 [Paraphoma chrysanthemicola]|nr:hypothetical protein BKA63DRAFT_226029 [Paraphoma chrysanthemicola]